MSSQLKVALLLAAATSLATAFELTYDNWNDETAGKTVCGAARSWLDPVMRRCSSSSSLTTVAPGRCTHTVRSARLWPVRVRPLTEFCQSMKPAWIKLMEVNATLHCVCSETVLPQDFKSSTSSLVAVFDCTATRANHQLCVDIGVERFPTMKYGTPIFLGAGLEMYEGGWAYDDLSAFAKKILPASCGPANLDLCDAGQKAEIEKMIAMPDADLDASIAEKEKMIKDAKAEFKAGVADLDAQHEVG